MTCGLRLVSQHEKPWLEHLGDHYGGVIWKNAFQLSGFRTLAEGYLLPLSSEEAMLLQKSS